MTAALRVLREELRGQFDDEALAGVLAAAERLEAAHGPVAPEDEKWLRKMFWDLSADLERTR